MSVGRRNDRGARDIVIAMIAAIEALERALVSMGKVATQQLSDLPKRERGTQGEGEARASGRADKAS